jgi:hypothetical protein
MMLLVELSLVEPFCVSGSLAHSLAPFYLLAAGLNSLGDSWRSRGHSVQRRPPMGSRSRDRLVVVRFRFRSRSAIPNPIRIGAAGTQLHRSGDIAPAKSTDNNQPEISQPLDSRRS